MTRPISVDEVLDLHTADLGELERPVLVLVLEGWFDMAGAATRAVDELFDRSHRLTIGEIDPDPFYDFTVERPRVEMTDGELRQIIWPENRIDLWRAPGGGRHVVVLTGVEPHLYWDTFARAVIEVAERLGCQLVVTLGAGAEAIPHSRRPFVTGSSTTVDLARRLGLSAPSYQGVTGLVGVLQTLLDNIGRPSVSLRVGIPHYLSNTGHPMSSAALVDHLSHVLGLGVDADLSDDIAAARAMHDEVVAADPQLAMYVAMLEREHDRRTEAQIPSAEDLGAELEEFLRGLDDDTDS